ncbi:DUF4255 domain-containing protein [Burkholderia ubonensis]|uniref:DUF4255 domain-containing protein n=1 Tax=Burkholderia ubonensis TaxID=101571 RepID=UPI00075680F6|nr:DUF4255 domain-containing protein [Burkholderia ubonensis]KWN66031.1 hypothetical protein WM23_07605 [Burkholderia ubonensis]
MNTESRKHKVQPSDNTLLKLNEAIQDVLRAYLADDEVEIRFDVPGQTYENPTVNVFLYDIQEDLQLRSGEGRRYDPGSGKLLPGRVHVRCCYLITFWGSKEEEDKKGDEERLKGPDNVTHVRINQVLNALLNQREIAGLQPSYTRVIPPTEELNSLGTFWQALGDKPRLCLSYMVTVPIRLGVDDEKDTVPPVKALHGQLDRKPAVAWYARAAEAVRRELGRALEAKNTYGETERIALAKLRIGCTPWLAPDKKETAAAGDVQLELSGVVTQPMHDVIKAALKEWQRADKPLCEVAEVPLRVRRLVPLDKQGEDGEEGEERHKDQQDEDDDEGPLKKRLVVLKEDADQTRKGGA